MTCPTCKGEGVTQDKHSPGVGDRWGDLFWQMCGACGGTGRSDIRDPEGTGMTPAQKAEALIDDPNLRERRQWLRRLIESASAQGTHPTHLVFGSFAALAQFGFEPRDEFEGCKLSVNPLVAAGSVIALNENLQGKGPARPWD